MTGIGTAIRSMMRGRRDQSALISGPLNSRFPDADASTLTRIAECSRYTMTSPERLFALISAVDYGHWKGARQAVDEYLFKNSVRMHLCRIDYTGRIGIKH